jgi:uncharacterized LabA/DUF88 family protein
MLINKRTETAAILVDGANVYSTCKALGFEIDYKRLLASFEGVVMKAYYFTAMAPRTEQSNLRPMIDWLEYNGWTIIQKDYKEFRDSVRYRCSHCNEDNVVTTTKTKGNMDIEMAVIANEIAPYVTDLFIFTGDGDFRFLVEALQRRYGIRVNVVSSIKTTPPMCADELRRQADEFIEISGMREQIERKADERRTRT